MTKTISHSFLLHCGLVVLLLMASLPLPALGQSIDVPANIAVTINLNCGTANFLNSNNAYAGGYDFFITGGSITGTVAADSVSGCGTFFLPTLSGSIPLPASATTPSTPISSMATLTVDAYYNPGCAPSTPSSIYYDPYTISGYLTLANEETYFLSPFESDGPVIPASGNDPNFPTVTGYPQPFGLNSVTDNETPGVISIGFLCTNNGTLPPLQITGVTAKIIGSVTPQATLPGFTYAGPIDLLVRSGSGYVVVVNY